MSLKLRPSSADVSGQGSSPMAHLSNYGHGPPPALGGHPRHLMSIKSMSLSWNSVLEHSLYSTGTEIKNSLQELHQRMHHGSEGRKMCQNAVEQTLE